MRELTVLQQFFRTTASGSGGGAIAPQDFVELNPQASKPAGTSPFLWASSPPGMTDRKLSVFGGYDKMVYGIGERRFIVSPRQYNFRSNFHAFFHLVEGKQIYPVLGLDLSNGQWAIRLLFYWDGGNPTQNISLASITGQNFGFVASISLTTAGNIEGIVLNSSGSTLPDFSFSFPASQGFNYVVMGSDGTQSFAGLNGGASQTQPSPTWAMGIDDYLATLGAGIVGGAGTEVYLLEFAWEGTGSNFASLFTTPNVPFCGYGLWLGDTLIGIDLP